MQSAEPTVDARWEVSIANVDGTGRVGLGRLFTSLGWSAPGFLTGHVETGCLIVGAVSPGRCGVREAVGGSTEHAAESPLEALRVDPARRLRLPGRLRVRLGVSASGRALLGARVGLGVLVVCRLGALEELLEGALDACGDTRAARGIR